MLTTRPPKPLEPPHRDEQYEIILLRISLLDRDVMSQCVSRRFEGTKCLYLQGSSSPRKNSLSPVLTVLGGLLDPETRRH
jgi:hypothetical protein